MYSLDFSFALSMFHLLNTNTCLWFDAFKHMNKKPKYWLLAVRNVHWWLCWFTWNLTVKSFMTYVRWDVSDFNLNPTYAALIISILLSLRSCSKSQSIGLCLPFEIWICGCICLILLLLYSFCTHRYKYSRVFEYLFDIWIQSSIICKIESNSLICFNECELIIIIIIVWKMMALMCHCASVSVRV